MKIPLLVGREFDERERLGSTPVAIVNEAWVKTNMEGQNPLGQHIVSHGLDSKLQEMEIIGVAKNAKYNDLRDKPPAIV